MADRALPFGQVTPTARPIGAFVQAAQPDVAAPARPTELPSPRGMNMLQQSGTTNVGGFNQFEQLATALAPFSKNLLDTVGQGYLSYARGKIEEGYYDQLKNQHARAMLSLQTQAETGAANAASQIGELQKKDPEAAQLLKEANPWKLIGRRRALAQLAGSEIEDALENDITVNAGELVRLTGPELKARQVQLTSQVLNRYQLTGEEPEVNFYVTPKVNQAWEKYSDQQRKFYNKAVEDSTQSAATAATTMLVQRVLTTDATVDGQTYKVGSPEWRAYGAATITVALDQQLRLLDPEARSRVVKHIREQVGGVYANTPYGAQLLQEIRGGDPSVPYEKRPTWGAAAPLEMLELNVRGQKAVQEQRDLQQQTLKNQLDALWYGTPNEKGPGSLDPTDPAYAAAVLGFRNKALGMGYMTPEEYISDRAKDQSQFVQIVRPPDPFEAEDFVVRINQAGPSVWTDDPNAYINALKAAREIANREPTPEMRAETYRRLVGEIDKARTAAGEFDAGVKDRVQNEVLQDLDSEAVRKLRAKQKVNGQQGNALDQVLANRLAGGASVATAMASTYQNVQLTAAANQLTALYERALSQGIRNWKDSHPGQVMSPQARSVVMSEASAAARKSADYARIIKDLTGLPPGQVGPAEGLKTRQQGRGVSRAASKNLPLSTVQAYGARPVMEPQWVVAELRNLQQGKPVSKELYDLAKRAGTSTTRYLLEQVRGYQSKLDPDGTNMRYLQEKLQKEKAGRTVAGSNLQSLLPTGVGGWNPLAPGGWLMTMLTPPAAAATLDLAPRMPRSGFGGGGGASSSGPPASALQFNQIPGGQAKLRNLAQLVSSAGFPRHELATMVAIAMAESGGRATAHNPNRSTGDDSYGLWQINMIDSLGPERRRQFGISNNQALFDPSINAMAAKKVREAQGFAAWSVYRSGAYKEYLPAAERVVQQMFSSGRTSGRGRRVSAEPNTDLGNQFIAQLGDEGGYEDAAGPAVMRRPWAGDAGQFASKGSLQNGLDALNKAGASLMGFIKHNPNDIRLVQKFYSENPAVANQYDLPVNLFLRYVSGVGAKDLKVSQAQGMAILQNIKDATRSIASSVKSAERWLNPAESASFKRKVAKGLIPVAPTAPYDGVSLSLGRFWAEPQQDGSYVVTENFDFAYAPASQGGNDKLAGATRQVVGVPTDPATVGRSLVVSGVGKPFKYRLKVYPGGQVEVLSLSGKRRD